jgi:hypothetical protein
VRDSRFGVDMGDRRIAARTEVELAQYQHKSVVKGYPIW